MAPNIEPYFNPPTKGVSAAFAVLFALSGIHHAYQNSKYKDWRLLWGLPLASVLFTAAFICRECSAFFTDNDGLFAASEGLMLCGMPIITCCIYCILVLPIAAHPQHSPVRLSLAWYIPMVFNCVIISITSQGTSTLYSPLNSTSSSLALLRAGSVLDLVFIFSLVGILAVFHHSCAAEWKLNSAEDRKLKKLIFLLYGCAALITICDTFRTVQIFSAPHTAIWRTQALFWVFDALPLLLCMFALNVMHPGRAFQD